MSSQPDAPKAGSDSLSATSDSLPERTPHAEFGFPPSRRIRKRADFQAVYHEGVRLGSNLFTVFARATQAGHPARIGLTVTRKIGKAATRSRCKRLLREAVRKHWKMLPEGVDVVLHARRGLVQARFFDVENELVAVLPKALRRLG